MGRPLVADTARVLDGRFFVVADVFRRAIEPPGSPLEMSLAAVRQGADGLNKPEVMEHRLDVLRGL